ncbi:MAG: serine/threonine-protein kinase [Nannocystaceae bacterium]|nr:serine/threonine-protein kinase [Nannocystaceae bacterium]
MGDSSIERVATGVAPTLAPTQTGSRTRASEALPTRVGRFVVLRRLGAGGMGVVLLAYDEPLDRKVAVKLLFPEFASDPERQRRLLHEAQVLAKLSHPHVVVVHEAGEDQGRWYLAMEFVEGQTLRQWAAQSRSVGQLLDAFVQAGRGLAAAHAMGVIHRDFKPDNVMVDPGGRVRVLDFGLAVSLAQAGDDAIAGTPAYMAPEQLAGRELDGRTDQYALCVSLAECLLGRRPAMQPGGGVGPNALADRRIGRGLRAVLERGLALRPADRFEDMAALLRALERVRRPSRWWWAPGLLAAGFALRYALPGVEAAPCGGIAAEIEPDWNPQVQAALVAAAGVDARPPWFDVIDAWRERWIAAATRVCEDTRVRRVQSEEMLDRQRTCLAGQRRTLRAMTEVVIDRGAAELARAQGRVAGLPRPEDCTDPAQLTDVEPPPPAIADEVEQLRMRLARARVLAEGGDGHAALSLIDDIAAEADRLGYPPLRAEVEARRGHAAIAAGDPAAARASLRRAYQLARKSSYDIVAFDAAIRMAATLSSIDTTQAALWLDLAELELAGGIGTEPAIRLDLTRARIASSEHRYADALPPLAQALAAATEHGSDPLVIADIRERLGTAYAHLGRYDESIAEHLVVLQTRERLMADGNPERAFPLINIGTALRGAGRLAESLDWLARGERALAVALGEDHPNHAAALFNLAATERALLRLDDALAHLRRVETIERAAYGENSGARADTLVALAEVLRERGESAEATRLLQEAVEIYERTVGPQSPRAQTARQALERSIAAPPGR